MDFYSHIARDEKNNITKQKLLSAHLSEVAKQMKETINQLPIDNRARLAQVAYFIGISHDFGKFTTYFQNYLLYDSQENSLHFHGFISAVFAAYIIQQFWEPKEPYETYMPLISYFFVLHHHGNLGNIEDDILPKRFINDPSQLNENKRWFDKLNILKKQIADIKLNGQQIEEQYKQMGIPLSLEHFISHWQDTLREVDMQRYRFINKEDEQLCFRVLIMGLTLYSALIDNDKMDAAEVTIGERKFLPADLVDRYREKNFNNTDKKPLDELRNNIYRSVVNNIETVPLSQHLFTITAPTGSGKTLTGFSAAIKLRNRIEHQLGYRPRIIYSLPFTSIIDQNYAVLKDVLEQLNDFKQNEGLYLIKHHHLSELSYTKEGEEQPLDKALMLIESWQAEVIITTFIQLFYTLIGYKNKFLKKYHNIAGSIILLDEIQNVDVKYWPLINRTIQMAAQQLGCYAILMTATRPLIFKEGEATELVEQPKQYFSALNRVSLQLHMHSVTVEELADEFMNIYDEQHSYLVVMNTIKSSIQLYNLLKERIKSPCFYLSTNIIPKHRAQRIKEIKTHTDKHEAIVVISTQVIEAGVDVDMDIVIRDIGPIDSIIQVAGRCKRNSIDDKGKVYIYKVVDKKDEIHEGTLLAKRIYGAIHCSLAMKALANDTIPEKLFYEMINNYFNDLEQYDSQQQSKDILEAMRFLRFSKEDSDIPTVSSFSLIEDQPNYADVFIEIDQEAQNIWDEYSQKVLSEENENKKREARLRLKGKLDSYIISIPDKLAMGLQPYMAVSKDRMFWKLPLEGWDLFYDLDTGFKRSLETEAWIL